MSKLKNSGSTKHNSFAGCASLALEVGINNFVYGKILVIDSGVYSSRLKKCVNLQNSNKNIKKSSQLIGKISVIKKNTIGLFLA